MILITTALLGMAAVALLSMFWKDICNFLQRAMAKVKQIVTGIVMGSKIFIKKMREAYQEISKTYSYDRGQWQETIATRTVPASDVPDDIRALVGSSEVDITNQLEMKLSA